MEAAHIVRYADQGANSAANGLLLRADIHTAFDLHLIWVDADTMRVRVAPSIEDRTYRDLDDNELRRPTSPTSAPNAEALRRHAVEAQKKHAGAQERRAKRQPPRR